jgi:osmotically inducible protein OsmC
MSFRVIRTAHASWQGSASGGGGRLELGSGAFEGPYSLRARVEGEREPRVDAERDPRVEDVERATNPEELLGAAEAGCFTMSLANLLEERDHPARELRTRARVQLEQVGSAFNITRIELETIGEVPGVDEQTFAALAEQAKDCTVSRALTGTEIALQVSLASGERPN